MARFYPNLGVATFTQDWRGDWSPHPPQYTQTKACNGTGTFLLSGSRGCSQTARLEPPLPSNPSGTAHTHLSRLALRHRPRRVAGQRLRGQRGAGQRATAAPGQGGRAAAVVPLPRRPQGVGRGPPTRAGPSCALGRQDDWAAQQSRGVIYGVIGYQRLDANTRGGGAQDRQTQPAPRCAVLLVGGRQWGSRASARRPGRSGGVVPAVVEPVGGWGRPKAGPDAVLRGREGEAERTCQARERGTAHSGELLRTSLPDWKKKYIPGASKSC